MSFSSIQNLMLKVRINQRLI